jgi:hypothetical protein
VGTVAIVVVIAVEAFYKFIVYGGGFGCLSLSLGFGLGFLSLEGGLLGWFLELGLQVGELG